MPLTPATPEVRQVGTVLLHLLRYVAWCALCVLLQTAAIEEEMRQDPATAAILNALHGSRTTARERQTGGRLPLSAQVE